MKLSICLTVTLTALSVAAAPSLRNPVHLQERGSIGTAAGAFKAVPKVALHVSKPPHGNPSIHKLSRKPLRLAPLNPSRRPARRPQVRLPAQNQPGLGSIQNGPTSIGTLPAPPKSRPAPPKVRPAPPRPRPAPPRSRPAPRPRPQSNSDTLSEVGNIIGDVAKDLIPHFDLGSLFRRNRDQ